MWITISSDHNPDSRLRPSATAVHNDGMNSKTKRKHTNGFNEDRLMLINWAAPVLSQLVMLVIMIAQRQWLYVAMLAPGLISSALSLASMALRSNQKQQHDEPVSTTYAKVVETARQNSHSPFAAMPHMCFERFYALDEDALPWRTITRTWLSSTSSCPIGVTEHGLFRTDLQRSGPHAMVAGTTGSGKSELLISWCLSLAMQYSPDDLHFVFLDFKGGSTFNALEHLPHTVGNVCDLDLFHAIRALNAIEQELVRREALVSAERVSRFDQLVRPPARLVVVIDEFHALRDRLPDYMQRLNRLASLGRSLGMHLIVCTQYPMGQVHADMKANISLSICLRVTDQMQSNELIGIRDAALIPPSIPGAAYCNDGQHTTPFLCSAVRDVNRLVRNIGTAARFHACKRPDLLFSEPLTQHATQSDLSIPSNQSWHNVPFALADDGVLVYTAILDVSQQNIAIIGAYGSGKTNLLLHCARCLYDTGCANIRFTRKTEHGMVTDDGKPLPSHKRTIWIVDDADEALNPFSSAPEANELREALVNPNITVIAAVEKPISALLDRCPTRVAFPCGERSNDLMLGIPGAILDGFAADDYTLPGRGVLMQQAKACPIQCVEFQGF